MLILQTLNFHPMKQTNIFAIVATMLLQLAIATNLFAGEISDSLAKQKSFFYSAKQELNDMLLGKIPLDYERAIFIIEDAYWENRNDYSFYQSILDFHTENILRIISAKTDETQNFKPTLLETEEQKRAKYDRALTNWAIFSYMTDTSLFVGSNKTFLHLPFKYSTNDPLGTLNWRNTQVFNLLDSKNKKGNCFALVSLFKIFSERLSSEANICTAPGHIYIRHADNKGIYHNVELATRSFPGTGSMEVLTYTTDEATKNGISLRELGLKQSIALCLVYLAKGYEYKFKIKDDDFILKCAELTLQHDSLNLNAMLLKSEVLEQRIINKNKTIAQLQTDKQFKEYEKLISHLYKLGYREMPLEMKNLVISRLRNDTTPIIVKDHTPQPFKNLGVKDTRYATLSWGLFDEMHEEKPFEKFQRTVFDTKKRKISKFVPEDTTYNKYPIDMVVFAWNIDPLAAKYPFVSPYVFVNNNPILYKDPDGREWVNAYAEQAAKAEKALLDNPNSKSLQRELKNARTNESRVNEYLKNLKTNDEALYSYIDNLKVTDKSGNTANVKVYVYSDERSQGNQGQTAQTGYLRSGTEPNVDYEGESIIAPMRPSKPNQIGFDVTVYGNTSFGDERLANEAGDIMYNMEYNKDASKEPSQRTYFEEGKEAGMDKYLSSGAGEYSNRVDSKYRERKKSGEGKNKDSNPYPLAK